MEHRLLKNKYFLYATEFFAGMSVMAVELGASRLMAPYFSSSQIVWTVIIGVIMIAMAVGNLWGGRMADKSKSPDKLYGRLILAAIWIALIPFSGRAAWAATPRQETSANPSRSQTANPSGRRKSSARIPRNRARAPGGTMLCTSPPENSAICSPRPMRIVPDIEPFWA